MRKYNEVVRVAVNNNFNCTDEEFKQLKEYQEKYPDRYFFVNSNIKTPDLLAINDHYDTKIVITANPDLSVDHKFIHKLYYIPPDRVGFIRVKWLPGYPEIIDLSDQLLYDDFPVVLTIQRFNSKKSLQIWTDLEHYKFEDNRFRLVGDALKEVHEYVDSKSEEGLRAYICDRAGLGCGGCGLCSTLTTGKALKISSLNLSSSGRCPHSCIDCYAKTMQHFVEACGHTPIKYDVIKQNHKQKGATAHIKKHRKAA